MNTVIRLLYRDAGNNKSRCEVILRGEIDEIMITKIMQGADMRCFVLANQIGLPVPFDQVGAGYDEQLDHPWTTLEDFEDGTPSVKALLTHDHPTMDMTIDQVADAICMAQWDEAAEMEVMRAA